MIKRLCHVLVKPFSLYFMKGNDARYLSPALRESLLAQVSSTPYSDSYMIYDSQSVHQKISAWKSKLPWIKPFYAMKSNPLPQLVRDVIQRECGLDCASRDEISYALSQGLQPEQIVYSNPIKVENQLRWADQQKIQLTTADTLDQLRKVRVFAPNMKVLWRISIKQQDSKQLSTCFSNKFGDDISNSQQAFNRFKQLAELGYNIEGIHFHCGSGSKGSSGFKKAVEMAMTCTKIGRLLGHSMKVIDIGGGFPSGNLSDWHYQALKPTQQLDVKVMAEPGRHFSALSCALMMRVIGKRTKHGQVCYHVNDSLYHSFNCKLMDSVSFDNASNQFYGVQGKMTQSTIFGMTCDGQDVIASNLLTPNMNVGDWICVGGMGAYTIGPKSTFNGMHSTERVEMMPAEEKKQINQVEMQRQLAFI